jgi:DNA repair photolyase
VIPFLTDAELEHMLQAAQKHGARSAGCTLLRLPYEVKDLFKDWLATHYPLKAEHVMSRMREMRGGRENDPEFGSRFRGNGLFADLLEQRFRIACERMGFNLEDRPLDAARFKPTARNGQMDLL